MRCSVGGSNYVPPRGADKIRTASGPPILSEDNSMSTTEAEVTSLTWDYYLISVAK